MTHTVKSPRKLIEVALPLDAINEAAAREKSIRHGHPSTLHLWWARRPLAAARAVLFAQLVNDPGYQQGGGFKYGKNKKEAAAERKRLFKIIEDLVQWENTTNEEVLERARNEIRRSWREVCELNKDHPHASDIFNPDKLPAVHDPFAGGGTIPLEAQRLGLEAYASDLNPVALLINKAMIEIPPKFANRPPIGPLPADERQTVDGDWSGARGLAEDVRRYGDWMRSEAFKRIGHLYPDVEVTTLMARDRADLRTLIGRKLTVIAWLWARTVKSPNPAFSHVDVPLASTFVVSQKEDKQAYVVPIIQGDHYHFIVKTDALPPEAEQGTKANGRGANFRCLVSNVPISGAYIKREAQAGRMGQRLMAIVADGPQGRVYLPPSEQAEVLALKAKPSWQPDVEFFPQALGFRIGNYGMKKWSDLFTQRQLLALSSFADLVGEAVQKCRYDAIANGVPDSEVGLNEGGKGARAYAQAVGVYLALSVSKAVDYNATLVAWSNARDQAVHVFGRQALPMVWDFAEINPLAGAAGDPSVSLSGIVRNLGSFRVDRAGVCVQGDAQTQSVTSGKVVSTDPPYYDNIGYADLSDFFYVWLRRALQTTLPDMFASITAPKSDELVATPDRHGGRELAESFFLNGMTQALGNIARQCHPAFPVSVYYAFKQAETDMDLGTASTGWETFLEALLQSGFALHGTWPMRTERTGRMRGNASNALASSIILVCRKRPADAATVSRREFLRELNAVLPEALDEMTKGSGEERSPVAPVDLSQAIIGPGMAVFSKYAAVLEADGSPMSVRTALQLINRFLAEDDFDHDTQFCLHWFEQHGWGEGVFGEADVLARAKGTSVEGVKEAGVIQAGGGKVRLLKWAEYPADWNPSTDTRLPVWEALHQIIRAFRQGGDSASGALLAALGGKAEAVRQLSYRLYTLCERLGQAEDARAYNEVITSWSGIETAAASAPKPADQDLPGFER
jgi:putative DNA methylase